MQQWWNKINQDEIFVVYFLHSLLFPFVFISPFLISFISFLLYLAFICFSWHSIFFSSCIFFSFFCSSISGLQLVFTESTCGTSTWSVLIPDQTGGRNNGSRENSSKKMKLLLYPRSQCFRRNWYLVENVWKQISDRHMESKANEKWNITSKGYINRK